MAALERTRTRPAPRSRSRRWALGVNAALLIALAASFAPRIDLAGPAASAAQPDAGREAPSAPASFRPPGRYLAVSGDTGAGSTHAIWILDEVNQEMLAVQWDASRESLGVIGYRDLRADARAGAPR